jgi:hypothetical protein
VQPWVRMPLFGPGAAKVLSQLTPTACPKYFTVDPTHAHITHTCAHNDLLYAQARTRRGDDFACIALDEIENHIGRGRAATITAPLV